MHVEDTEAGVREIQEHGGQVRSDARCAALLEIDVTKVQILALVTDAELEITTVQGVQGNPIAKVTGEALALLDRGHTQVEAMPVSAEVPARPVELPAQTRFRAPAEAPAKTICLEGRQPQLQRYGSLGTFIRRTCLDRHLAEMAAPAQGATLVGQQITVEGHAGLDDEIALQVAVRKARRPEADGADDVTPTGLQYQPNVCCVAFEVDLDAVRRIAGILIAKLTGETEETFLLTFVVLVIEARTGGEVRSTEGGEQLLVGAAGSLHGERHGIDGQRGAALDFVSRAPALSRVVRSRQPRIDRRSVVTKGLQRPADRRRRLFVECFDARRG